MVNISEARLNDLAYMALKKLFFEAMFGEGRGPRECDIRIVMDMTVPSRITPASAILLPNEKSGKSHTVFYDVDTDKVLTETIDYMEDHWLKQNIEEAFGDPDVRTKMTEYYAEIVKVILDMPEADCGG